jgi:hypothetical protein
MGIIVSDLLPAGSMTPEEYREYKKKKKAKWKLWSGNHTKGSNPANWNIS